MHRTAKRSHHRLQDFVGIISESPVQATATYSDPQKLLDYRHFFSSESTKIQISCILSCMVNQRYLDLDFNLCLSSNSKFGNDTAYWFFWKQNTSVHQNMFFWTETELDPHATQKCDIHMISL